MEELFWSGVGKPLLDEKELIENLIKEKKRNLIIRMPPHTAKPLLLIYTALKNALLNEQELSCCMYSYQRITDVAFDLATGILSKSKIPFHVKEKSIFLQNGSSIEFLKWFPRFDGNTDDHYSKYKSFFVDLDVDDYRNLKIKRTIAFDTTQKKETKIIFEQLKPFSITYKIVDEKYPQKYTKIMVIDRNFYISKSGTFKSELDKKKHIGDNRKLYKELGWLNG